MKTSTETSRGSRVSKDEKWRSFGKVPNLLQYVSTRTYYGRVKIDGKIIRQSLETDVWTTAKLRLVDFLKEKQDEPKLGVECLTFAEAVALFESDLKSDHSLKPLSIEYRQRCITKILSTWKDVEGRQLNEILSADCKAWLDALEAAPQYFNNIVDTIRNIFARGIKAYVDKGGIPFENPAKELSKVRIKQKVLQLPEADQFRALVENIKRETRGGWGPSCAELVRFLAFSGLRVNSEAKLVTWEDVDWKRKEIIVRGDPTTATKNSEIRRIPILPDMERLLLELTAKWGDETPTGRLLDVAECSESLERACDAVGIKKLTHHDLRHLFATRCIESGVDIPTVARWLGHKDGGGLAMKTYGHLRNEHSQAMAQKVKF